MTKTALSRKKIRSKKRVGERKIVEGNARIDDETSKTNGEEESAFDKKIFLQNF